MQILHVFLLVISYIQAMHKDQCTSFGNTWVPMPAIRPMTSSHAQSHDANGPHWGPAKWAAEKYRDPVVCHLQSASSHWELSWNLANNWTLTTQVQCFLDSFYKNTNRKRTTVQSLKEEMGKKDQSHSCTLLHKLEKDERNKVLHTAVSDATGGRQDAVIQRMAVITIQ